MNKEKFKEYLESVGGVYDWKGRNHSNVGFFAVSEGWYSLIKDMMDELIAVGWDRHLHQCKEKFGGLRFYLSTYPEGATEIVTKYESLSYETCEVCGEKGVLRTGSWLVTRCDEHSEGKPAYSKK